LPASTARNIYGFSGEAGEQLTSFLEIRSPRDGEESVDPSERDATDVNQPHTRKSAYPKNAGTGPAPRPIETGVVALAYNHMV
jgi:hypothetical protein